VNKLRVHRASQNRAVIFLEFGLGLSEGNDFGWADESEVHGVEEQKDVLSFVAVQGDLFELSLVKGGC
jgi:hypothetical protein